MSTLIGLGLGLGIVAKFLKMDIGTFDHTHCFDHTHYHCIVNKRYHWQLINAVFFSNNH